MRMKRCETRTKRKTKGTKADADSDWSRGGLPNPNSYCKRGKTGRKVTLREKWNHFIQFLENWDNLKREQRKSAKFKQ